VGAPTPRGKGATMGDTPTRLKNRHISGTRLLTPGETAERLRVSLPTLARWRQSGSGPPFVKFSRTKQAIVRYRESDLLEFIDENLQASTSAS